MNERRLSVDLQDLNSRLRTREMLPWTTEQVVSLIGANAIAVMLIAVGWWQTLTRDSSPSEQFGWFNLGLVGLAVAGISNVLWLARGRRTVTFAKSAVLPHSWIRSEGSHGASAFAGVWTVVPGVPAPAPSLNGHRRTRAGSIGGALVASDTMSRYHRPDCILVAGKPVVATDLRRHRDAGRQACEVCQP